MAFKLKGKEEKFFGILEEHAQLCQDASLILLSVCKGELDKAAGFRDIDVKEKRADELVNETAGFSSAALATLINEALLNMIKSYKKNLDYQ